MPISYPPFVPSKNMLIDVGMPVLHQNVAYNCRVVFLNRRILLIRPKLTNCDDGCYRETRWFTAWPRRQHTEQHRLSAAIAQITGQTMVPIGDALLALRDTCLGYEICEELWHVNSTHIAATLSGAEIIANASGSYMELRKAHIVADLVRSASAKAACVYLYSNLRGCDGQRVYFNGCSAVAVCGEFVARARQFALQDCEVSVATIDLDDVRGQRLAMRSRSLASAEAAAGAVQYPRVEVDFALAASSSGGDDDADDLYTLPSRRIEWTYHSAEEEIALGPACWLWDYLRRSGQGGYFLPLSGGVDSAATACIVHSMCRLIVEAVQAGDAQVLDDVRRILGDAAYTPAVPASLCDRLLVTCYMGGQNSSEGTRRLASELAGQLGTHHLEVNIDGAVSALLAIFSTLTGGVVPRFRAHGGCPRQNLALQNIQARTRMVLAYLLAQLMLWVRGRPGGLLVLGSANVDESLRGYMTKYDCSAADVNPIGGISKTDLHGFLVYAERKFGVPALGPIVEQPPTAELEPLRDGAVAQTDEEDMGMSYGELSEFGRLRKQQHCGPYGMFCRLVGAWSGRCSAVEVADKVKHFFRCYAINRHKMTVLTPSYHAESYSPDDNRFDHRPFLYRANWSWQFRAIDEQVRRGNESDYPNRLFNSS